MRCRRAEASNARSAIVVNATAASNRAIGAAAVEAKPGDDVFIRKFGNAAALAIAPAGVNHCGGRPNNTSDFDTIGHAPALGFG